MAYIEFTEGSYAGQRRDLSSESITIGRDPDAHILLDDLSASTKHAELRFHEGQWWILDLGSANGTELNEEPIESAALESGDLVTVGLTSFIFQNEIADEPATAAPAETAVNTNENELALVEKMKVLTERIRAEVGKVIVGQKDVLDQILMCILANGHALLIGLPGMAKTLTVKTISEVLNLNFKRVQFTPDLMPADILGSEILDTAKDGSRAFRFVEGPVFCQLLMADEINRASPRTQSALLQAMQEKEVTIAGEHRPLGVPFHVLATQNPIEQEGTYPLPEAQLDRFLVQIDVPYPDRATERDILIATTGTEEEEATQVFTAAELLEAQTILRRMPVGDNIVEMILDLVRACRPDESASDIVRNAVSWGPGPRAAQALMLTVRAQALLEGRLAPSAEDVMAMAVPVLEHRMALSFAARARGETVTSIINAVAAEITKVKAAAA